MKLLVGEAVWPELERRALAGIPKKAAVAYVSDDSRVSFEDGDLLIVDASDRAIAAGATDPVVLERSLGRGATLYSSHNLHAKLYVFPDALLLGSCNISRNSAERLFESALLIEEREIWTVASDLIESLAARSERIDGAFIERAKLVERQPQTEPGGPLVQEKAQVVYFQEVLPGDVKKSRAESSSARTGGGARDLRIPQGDYENVLASLFNCNAEEGVRQTVVNWMDSDGTRRKLALELWLPTEARQNELRIARFGEVGPWHLDPNTYAAARQRGDKWYFLLELDAQGQRNARLITPENLHQEDALVRDHIASRVQASRSENAVRGAVDVRAGGCYPVQ